MILLVSAVFPPEPVVSANLSYDIATALAENEEVTVLSPPPTRPYGSQYTAETNVAKTTKFDHLVLPTYTSPKSRIVGRMIESVSFGKATADFIHQYHKDIDVIYANTWPLFAQKYLLSAAKKYDIPVVLHIQDIYPESLSKKIPLFGSLIDKLLLPVDKSILQDSLQIITISEQMKRYLSQTRMIDSKKIDVVRNWQNDEQFLTVQNTALPEFEGFTFMYLGSINPTAGIPLLIHAFAKAALAEATLCIAGDGPEKKACMEIAQKYPDANIVFHSVSGDDVPAMQAQADVLLLPLKRGIAQTALPSKLTAYLFSSKPVIASIDTDSEAAQIIYTADCGLVVPPEDEDALILAMQEMHDHSQEKRTKMGMKGQLYAKEHLSKEHNLTKIITYILSLKRGQ